MTAPALNLSDVLKDSPLVVLGAGHLAATALKEAGLGDTSMLRVEPKTGLFEPSQTAQQILTPPELRPPSGSPSIPQINIPQIGGMNSGMKFS